MARTAETAENRRTRLVVIARGVIAEQGIAACTFRTLAKAAGTSTRPFTHAFGTREALLRAVALTTWDTNDLGVRTVIVGIARPAHWNCIDEVTQLGEAWLPLSDEKSSGERIHLEIVLYGLSHPELEQELLGFSSASNNHMAVIFSEGQKRQQLRTDRTVQELVMAYWSYAEGLSFSAVYEPKALPRDMLLGLWRDGLRRLLQP